MRKAKSELMKKINGAAATFAIAAAIDLQIIETLATDKMTLPELAKTLSLEAKTLKVLVEQLKMFKILVEDEASLLQLTEEGVFLTKSHPESMRPLARYKASPLLTKPFSYLGEALRTGKSPFILAFQKTLFEYLAENEKEREVYHEAMEYYEKESSKEILSLYDFSKLQQIVDVGGGRGAFLRTLKEHYPHLVGTVFDREEVLASYQGNKISGDFFKEVPPRADGYILRNILHDWDDKECLLILKNVRAAMRKSSHLLLFETIKSDDTHVGKFSDMTLFLLTSGGRGRTAEEIRTLVEKSDLHLEKVTQTKAAKGLFVVTCPR